MSHSRNHPAPGTVDILLLLLLTVVLTWPTAITLTTHVVDRQDPLLNSWIMAWEARQVLADPLHLYDANIFVPHRNTLAFSETLFSTSALVAPLQWFSDSALLSYNVAFLLAFFTTSLGAYLLALYLTGRRGAALVAAIAFAWSPLRASQVSQVQLLYFGWLPLALLYLDRLLRGRAHAIHASSPSRGEQALPDNPPPREGWRKDALLFTLFTLLQLLASFYAALFTAFACLIYLAGWFLSKRRLRREAFYGLLLSGVLLALAILPITRPYFTVQRTLGAGWTLEMNEQFSASLQAYAYAPPASRLWGEITAPLHYVYGPCCPPTTLFPGVTVLLLSGLALWRGGNRRWLWLGIGLIAFLLSLGPTLTIRAIEPTGIALPYRWLWNYLPGFSALRAPVRWAVLVTLALSMLAAIGLARLRWRAAPLVALVALLLEFATVPLRVVPAPDPPAFVEWLDALPPTRIVELPLVAERPVTPVPANEPRLAWERSRLLEAQYFSTWHWHATPDGYSGYVPSRHGDFAREMAAFPSSRSVDLLRGLGVEYVVIHENDLDPLRASRLAGAMPPGVEEVARPDGARILRLSPATPSHLPALSLPVSTLPPRQSVDLPLLLTSPGTPYVPAVVEPVEVRVRWEGPGMQEGTAPLLWPLIVEEFALVHLPVETPSEGMWTLRVEGSYPDGQSFVVEGDVEVVEGQSSPQPIPVMLTSVTFVDEMSLSLVWETRGPLSRYYSASVQLLAEDGMVVTQQDGAPGGSTGTLLWQPGLPYEAQWTFDLPEGTTLSDYRLAIHWYDPEMGRPLSLWNGEHFVPRLERSLSRLPGGEP